MTYSVNVKIKRGLVTPDLFDWLENNGMQYNKDWNYDRARIHTNKGAADYDYTFNFIRSEDATLFALRWA